MAKVNPEFSNKIKEYGGFDLNLCYNCGNCTAVCSLSTEEESFPREMVRYSVLGLEEDIKSSLKPWLCYYCGECSETCPQQANPGELMMALRRWLTSKYDWTGLSGLLYKSLFISALSFVLVAVGIIIFSATENFNLEIIMHYGHIFEIMSIIGVFLIILAPGIIRMWWLVIVKPKIKISITKFIQESWELIVHMFTQKRTLGCDESRLRWFEHFILVIGYLTLLFTTVVFDWFGSENLFVIALGYLVSAIVFIVTIHFIYGRITKNKEINKFSQPSDWLFVIWLFLLGITAFFVRLFIDVHIIENNLWMYLFHIIVLAQWALIIVPFGKWTHFLYRSFAMYFRKIIAISN